MWTCSWRDLSRDFLSPRSIMSEEAIFAASLRLRCAGQKGIPIYSDGKAHHDHTLEDATACFRLRPVRVDCVEWSAVGRAGRE